MPKFRARKPRIALPRLPPLRVPLHPRYKRFGHTIRGRIPTLPRINGFISAADVLTLTNGIMGFLAIAVVTGAVKLYEPPFFPGLENVSPHLADDRWLLASVLLVVAMACDALDGIVARRFGGSRFGGDLDTLSDAISFVVAPAFLVFTYYGEERPFGALLAAGLVVIMGVLRLARFNANPNEKATTTFQGLPTPWNTICVALLVLARIPVSFALPIVVVLALLMMSNVAYPKSRGKTTLLAILMVMVGLSLVGFIIFFPENQPRIVRGTFTMVMLAVALLPFLLARRRQNGGR